MTHSEFSIGLHFYCAGVPHRCTDVGRRTIVAIKLDPHLPKATFEGPPYRVPEIVIAENDFDICSIALY